MGEAEAFIMWAWQLALYKECSVNYIIEEEDNAWNAALLLMAFVDMYGRVAGV